MRSTATTFRIAATLAASAIVGAALAGCGAGTAERDEAQSPATAPAALNDGSPRAAGSSGAGEPHAAATAPPRSSGASPNTRSNGSARPGASSPVGTGRGHAGPGPGHTGPRSGQTGPGTHAAPGTDRPSARSSGTATDPNSPFVVASAAVATRSRDQVVTLHAMGLATTVRSSRAGIPRDQVPHVAGSIRDALDREIADATLLTPPAGTPAARLVTALRTYRGLADRLAGWDPAGGQASPAWFGALAANDRAWRTALHDLGDLSGQNLLAHLPPLLMPRR